MVAYLISFIFYFSACFRRVKTEIKQLTQKHIKAIIAKYKTTPIKPFSKKDSYSAKEIIDIAIEQITLLIVDILIVVFSVKSFSILKLLWKYKLLQKNTKEK